MTKAQALEYIVLTTPFQADEISDDTLAAIIKNSLIILNKYSPKIIRDDVSAASNAEYTRRNIRQLRAYIDMFDTTFDQNYNVLDLYQRGARQGYFVWWALDWTLEELTDSDKVEFADSNINAYNYFLELLAAHAYKYCGNKRRSAILNELPFDIKGDTFFQEGEEKIKAVITEMSNNMPNVL